jgi:Zn-dependent metalloprotease
MIRGALATAAQAAVRAAARATVRAPGATILALLLLTLTLPIPTAQAADRRRADDGWAARPMSQAAIHERDRAALRGLPARMRVGYHPATGRVRFLSGSPRRPLTAGLAAVASGKRRLTVAAARSRASWFIDRYGGLFGLASPGRELRARQVRRHRMAASAGPVDSVSTAAAISSNVTVRFDQSRAGLPVMGGQIVVQLSGQGEVISAAGEVLPSAAEVGTRPRLSAARAGTIAATWLSRSAGRSPSAVTVRSEGLALYDPRIMGDPNVTSAGPRLAWRIDARLPASRGQEARHQLVVVDAHGGQVLTSIGRIYRVERIVCDNEGAPGRSFRCEPPYTRGEGQASSGIADVDAAYRLMGVVDGYFAGRFGRSGLDGQGARLKATVRYCTAGDCPWRNAEWKWAEQQAIFGSGWAKADDIVAHELTHGLLDHEVPLFYHYQSGAINESLADIFGELIDLSYPGGMDTAATLWRIGEDAPGGAIRDMRDPTRFGHPDRVLSPHWFTGSSDDGGVHHNSGVGNKAATLIADGGRFRGYDLAGIGRIQTARIFYQAVTTRLTPAANYVDLADALVAACIDLAGSEGLTSAQCSTVRDAVAATQMSSQPKRLAPRRAPLCAPGKRALDVFYDDLEDPAAGRWVIEGLAGGRKGWYYPQNPNHDPSWDGTWASSGTINFFAPNRDRTSDATIQTRSPVFLPAGAFLRFEHGYAFDSDAKRRYDGGVVEIKTGAGPWQDVNALFTHGGYNGRVARSFGNALAGRRAYTANSHGWSAARVDLAPFAGAWLKLRFRMASDRVVSGRGWYIDDIRVYSCADDADRPSGTLSIADGAASTSDPNVSLSVTYADATTWVTHLRVSGSAQLDAAGQLLQGITMPIRERLSWTLTDSASGGLDGLGSKWVHAQVRDAAGNWSVVFGDDIELIAAP